MGKVASDEQSIVVLFSNWLDREREGRLLLDEQLKILWHNRAARAWLDEPNCPLRLSGEKLVAKDARLQCRFASLFSGTGGSLKTILVADSSHAEETLLCARQVGEFGRLTCFGLCVRSIGEGHTHELVGLGDAFNLTPSEEAVLKKMVRGNTVERIARSSKTSPETVRTHVRRAYSKMSVSSREEMFRRITPFLFGR